MSSRVAEAKRRMRRDTHREMAVPALYLATPTAEPRPCTVRVWLKTDKNMVGALQGMNGAAEMAEPEDRLRFDLSEISMIRRLAVVSVAVGEAYRIDNPYPASGGFQTARVIPLSAAEAEDLPVPA